MKQITFLLLLVMAHIAIAQKPRLTVQVGHTNLISTLAVSPNGELIATGGLDNAVKLWDYNTGRLLHTFNGHQNLVKAVVFSDTGDKLISAGYDKAIVVWDSNTGAKLQVLTAHQKGIEALSLHPSGKIMASADLGGAITLWNLNAGKPILQIQDGSEVYAVAFHPNGKILATTAQDNAIKLWDIATGSAVAEFSGHAAAVKQLRYSHDGKMLASADEQGAAIVWDAATGDKLQVIDEAGVTLSSVAFSANDAHLLCGSLQNVAYEYIIENKGVWKAYKADEGQMVRLAGFVGDGGQMVSADGAELVIWSTSSAQAERRIAGSSSMLTSVGFSTDGRLIGAAYKGQTAKVWDFVTGRGMKSFEGHTDAVEDLCFVPESKNMITVSRDKSIKVWDVAKVKELASYTEHTAGVHAVSTRVDGLYFATGGDDNRVMLWDIRSGRMVRMFSGHTGRVSAVDIHPNGKYIASASLDKTLKIWDVDDNKLLKTLVGHTQEVLAVKFSADGKRMASAGIDKQLLIWNTATWTIERTIANAHDDYIQALAFSADGKQLASGAWDAQIKLWQVETAKPLSTLQGHTNYVRSLAFGPHGKHLISGGSDSRLIIWDVPQAKKLLTVVAFNKGADYVVTSPEGFFDGTPAGIQQALHYVQGGDLLPLESFFELFYSPDLWQRVMAGEKLETPKLELDKPIDLPPAVKIVSPTVDFEPSLSEVTVKVQVIDRGGGIDQILLYHNGKLVETTQRGFKPVAKIGELKTKDFSVNLINGQNHFRAIAYSQDRLESKPFELSINYAGQQAESSLYLLAVGVDEYKNSVMNLNYATSDADLFVKAMKAGGQSIFKTVEPHYITNGEVTRQGIFTAFGEIAKKATAQDVFVFYYAGHGVMADVSGSDKQEFYLVPHDITQLYGAEDQLANKGISATELLELSRLVVAQKQLIVLDACQSGGALQSLTSVRGASQQKAMVQLARSAGVVILAASGSEQFATEVKELGHGIFTYALAEGLSGKADGGKQDKKITVNELKAYLEDRVPELTQQHRGQAQYPTGFTRGQDFPLVIVK